MKGTQTDGCPVNESQEQGLKRDTQGDRVPLRGSTSAQEQPGQNLFIPTTD